MMNAFRSASQDEETGIIHEINQATTLSWSTRLKWFIGCFVLGFIVSMLSLAIFYVTLSGFAVLYTVGNILSIGSTMFLVGPVKQVKNMFAPTRAIATIVVIVAFGLTFVAAFVAKKALLALLMVVIQFLAMTWYSISYIPYARDAVIGFFKSIF